MTSARCSGRWWRFRRRALPLSRLLSTAGIRIAAARPTDAVETSRHRVRIPGPGLRWLLSLWEFAVGEPHFVEISPLPPGLKQYYCEELTDRSPDLLCLQAQSGCPR